ncbi:MAG: DUF5107 domain-containing protein [Verrucomicrobia bacterium]|nr:DUF5107 domain-containing protein [Verrucomicrobiota bacterium]
MFEAIDKSNGYNFIYRQHVIKPALIGLIGAWISGGIEWNIPHHHRATTFLPVQYRLAWNPDGGKTVWVGELEIRHRMRWAVGYTLHPGKSYLECSVRIVNRTPVVHAMLCFANVAVHATKDYQVIYPPSTPFVTFHGKRDFTTWPWATTRYAGADFTRGVDVSWYANHIAANSMFAWNYEDDFFAGYDHGKQAGIMSVADHHQVPGNKFWTWGNGPRGRMWEKFLTDNDGPYIELMAGAYSDNQPDYSWLQPYETKASKMYWYPFRDIGGVKKANLEAAVNLEVSTNGIARVGFCTTRAHRIARALLQVGSPTLLDRNIAISPGKPFVQTVPLPVGTDEHDLRAALSVGGQELTYYYGAEFSERLGDAAQAAAYRRLGRLTAPDTVFPFQRGLLPVLRRAMVADPQDSRAAYYLGDLLFDSQPEAALELWQQSVAHPRTRSVNCLAAVPSRQRFSTMPALGRLLERNVNHAKSRLGPVGPPSNDHRTTIELTSN